MHRVRIEQPIVEPLLLVTNARRKQASGKFIRRRRKRSLHGADKDISALLAVVGEKYIVRIKILLICGRLDVGAAMLELHNRLRADVAGFTFIKLRHRIGAG